MDQVSTFFLHSASRAGPSGDVKEKFLDEFYFRAAKNAVVYLPLPIGEIHAICVT